MAHRPFFSSLVKSSTAILAFALFASPAFAKKTVCSATLNSDNEIKAFKDIMGTDDFDYVELTNSANENSATKHDWFENSCANKVQCDILIISGHFGGTFFGSSGLVLAMEDIEKGACDRRCDGILQKPKEVFLFGCNTLAGKTRDRRTPEEYRDVLIHDGFTPDEAERIVSFRYSPFGDSFSDRMRQVFPKTPRIYGNDSVGPTGKDIEVAWRRYLKSAKANGYYNRLDSLDTSVNKSLMSYLDWTAITQVSGDPGTLTEEQPVCKLANDRMSIKDKLLWVEKTFQSGRYLRSLPHIVDFFNDLEKKQDWIGRGERQILDRISQMKNVRAEIAPLLLKPDDALLGMQLQIYSLMTTLKWMTSDERAQGISRIVLGDVNRPFNQGRVDRIFSFQNLMEGIVVDFNGATIPEARWNEVHFLKALSALNYKSSVIEAKLLPMVTGQKVANDIRVAASQALGGLYGMSQNGLQTLVRELESNGDAAVRKASATALRAARADENSINKLIQATTRESNDGVLSAVLSSMPNSKSTMSAHIRLLERMPSSSLRLQIVNRLPRMAKLDKDAVQLALGAALSRETNGNVQYAILENLNRLGGVSWNAWAAVKAVDAFWSRTNNQDLKILAATTSEKMKGSSGGANF